MNASTPGLIRDILDEPYLFSSIAQHDDTGEVRKNAQAYDHVEV